VSVNENKWLVMHMHVQLQLDELWGPQTLGYKVVEALSVTFRLFATSLSIKPKRSS
jgi:hypothetical protein